MTARSLSAILCALALGSLPGAARAADPATDSPLVRALLRPLHPVAPLAATAQRATDGPAASAGAVREVPTALPSLRATAPLEPVGAVSTFRAPASGWAPSAGKLPSTLGVVGDNYGAALTTIGDMFGDGVSDVAVGAPYANGPAGMVGDVFVYFGAPGLYPPPSILYGEHPFDAFGQSIAGVGDVNGDGYPDLLVGAPFFDVGANTDAGKAYLYLGGPTGYPASPSWAFVTGEAGADVGFSVAWAGDVNSDGYDDWLVGAPNHTNSAIAQGAAYLFLGGPGPLSNTPAWTFEANGANANAGYSVSTAGDVNGDGYADILVGQPGFTSGFIFEGKVSLFFGHALKPSIAADDSFLGGQASAGLGQSVAAAGDVNGDGYADFIMAAPQWDGTQTNEGEALVQYGGPIPGLYRAPDRLTEGFVGARLGAAVATAGDINGDGYADVIVGAPNINNGTNSGRAFVFVGSQAGIIDEYYDVVQSLTANAILGVSVGTLGNYFNDGYSDYWAGAVGTTSVEAWSHQGHAFSPGFTEAPAAQGYVSGAHVGLSSAAADLNGDGYDDLISGTYNVGASDPSQGEVALYFGGPRPFQPSGLFPFVAPAPDWTFQGEVSDFLGVSLTNAGDINGDGYQDFAVGAPLHAGSSSLMGRAFLFYGSPTGPAAGPPWIAEGAQTGALVGYSVAGGGDLNGDGYDDLVVGAPQGSVGPVYQGLARVYYGSKFGLSHTPAVTYAGRHAGDLMGTGCAIVGDINGDGLDDLVVGAEADSVTTQGEGLAFVYYGSLTGVHAAPDDSIAGGSAGAQFGFSVYRVGDVNGDGYADVAIGAPSFSGGQISEGRVSVFLGSASGLQKPAAWTLLGDYVDEQLGLRGISGGDMNGDGYADLVVGSPSSNLDAAAGGSVRVYPGSPGGLGISPIFTEFGFNPDEQYGFSTIGRADFDGDGSPDLEYGAPGISLGISETGLALVRFGNCIWFDQRNNDRPLGAWRSDDTAPISPGLRSDSNTGFRLHGRGRSAAGRTRLKLVAEVKPLNVAFNANAGSFTRSGWQATSPVLGGQGSSSAFDQAIAGFAPGTRIHWRARWQSKNHLFPVTPWISTEQRNPTERQLVTAGGVGPVAVDPRPAAPRTLALAPAAPNPSTGPAALSFALPAAADARLALYDLRGALVRVLFDGPAVAGTTRVTWDGRDAAARAVRPGAYFVRLTSRGEERVGKLVRVD